MEKFELMYRGTKLQGTKSDNGDIIIHLPERKDSKGEGYVDTIERTVDGWMYNSMNLNDPKYFYNVWLNDDFSMARSSSFQKGIQTSTEKFDPNMKPGKSQMNDQCKVIYEIVGKMLEYELFGRSAEEVLKLRQDWLATSLQILGYASTDRVKKGLSDSAGYMALGMIHHQLAGVEYETVDGKEVTRDVGMKNLGANLYQKITPSGDKKYSIHIPQDMDRRKLKEMIEVLETHVKTNKEFIETQDGTSSRDGKMELIRGILPDYCLDMKGKIPEEHWAIYSKVVEDTAKTLMAMNYDLVPELDRINIPDATKFDELEFEDLIGSLVDTKEAAIACSIDDVFVMQETSRVEKQAEFLIDNSERVQASAVGAALHFLKEQAVLTREKKEKHYAEFDRLDKKHLHTGFWNPENKVAQEQGNPAGRKVDDDDGIEY